MEIKLKRLSTQSWSLAGGLSLLIFCLLLFDRWLHSSTRNSFPYTPPVLVAKYSIRAGQTLSPSHFELIAKDQLPSLPSDKSPLTDQDLGLVNGNRALIDIPQGQWLLKTHLLFQEKGNFALRVPKGYRAYALPFLQSLPVQPGDKVDILGIPKNNTRNPESLLEGILILDILNGTQKRTLTLALSPNQVPIIEAARRSGEIKFLLRNPDESNPIEKPQVKAKSISKKVILWAE